MFLEDALELVKDVLFGAEIVASILLVAFALGQVICLGTSLSCNFAESMGPGAGALMTVFCLWFVGTTFRSS